MGIALAACVLLAVPASVMAASDAVVLPAMDSAAPHAAFFADRPTVKAPVVSEAARALLAKQQASGAVAMPDEREFPFPRGWMLALLALAAVLVLVLFDRVHLAMKLAKLNDDAVRSSGLRAPLARN